MQQGGDCASGKAVTSHAENSSSNYLELGGEPECKLLYQGPNPAVRSWLSSRPAAVQKTFDPELVKYFFSNQSTSFGRGSCTLSLLELELLNPRCEPEKLPRP
jgi:hypothetical protein